MRPKKKIALVLIGFFALHALTWWIWGTEKLLVKGYEYLEGTEMCSPEVDGSIVSQEIYEDTTYTYIGERFWTTPIAGLDSVFSLEINGVEREVHSMKSKRRQGLLDESYSRDIAFRVNYIDREYANPYYQNAFISCWAFGSDWTEDHEPYLIWAFFGWIEVTNEEVVATWINKYRD